MIHSLLFVSISKRNSKNDIAVLMYLFPLPNDLTQLPNEYSFRLL